MVPAVQASRKAAFITKKKTAIGVVLVRRSPIMGVEGENHNPKVLLKGAGKTTEVDIKEQSCWRAGRKEGPRRTSRGDGAQFPCACAKAISDQKFKNIGGKTRKEGKGRHVRREEARFPKKSHSEKVGRDRQEGRKKKLSPGGADLLSPATGQT